MNAPEQHPERTEAQAATVYESLMKSVLSVVRDMPKEWKRLSESQQDGVLAQFDHHVKDAVRKACELIAADERPNILVELEQVTFKDGVKATVKMAKGGEARHQLADAVGGNVILVIADAQPYTKGERPKAEPEQTSLNLATSTEESMQEASEEEKRQREEAEQNCLDALAEIGFDVTAEEVASWTFEQITDARAFAAAYKNMQDGEELPVPEFLKGRKRADGGGLD